MKRQILSTALILISLPAYAHGDIFTLGLMLLGAMAVIAFHAYLVVVSILVTALFQLKLRSSTWVREAHLISSGAIAALLFYYIYSLNIGFGHRLLCTVAVVLLAHLPGTVILSLRKWHS